MSARPLSDKAPARRRGGSGERGDVRRRSAFVSLLVGYLIALAMIAFWPVPVDSGGRAFLAVLTDAVPWLTYGIIEFAANVVLFIPFGALLGSVLTRRWVAVPLALSSSAAIELGQLMLLSERTSDASDLAANTIGAAVGVLLVQVIGVNFQRPRQQRGTRL